jgi:hypothetical protein
MHPMRIRTVAAILGTLLGGVGCAAGAQVQSDLPIKRVVIYRNGVAYFERAGHVDGDDVRFKMRQSEVGDFLATLAVMEHGGSSVRAAAFPLKDVTGKPKDGETENRENALRTVVLSLDGRVHDLQVGYVAAAPVWRPSYRLILLPNGQADLQAWGIVQNLSGEDWTGVQLSLVAGAPLSFEARLGTAIIPNRPVMTDSGEVIAAVPKGESSAEADRDGDGIPDATDKCPDAGGGEDGCPEKEEDAESARPKEAKADAAASPAAPRKPAADKKTIATEGHVQPGGPRDVHSLAAIAVQGGTTEYDIPGRVTITDKNATMVMLLAKRVPGEPIYLFAPIDGVPDSASHPFHVARFQNSTGGVLERGPVAVFEKGAFLGQGLVDPLPASGWATVPFALERAIGVDSHAQRDVQGTRLAKIENGLLWVDHDVVVRTTYDVQNGGELAAKVLVKHSRLRGARLFEPPVGTEDNVGTGSALVPVTVPAHAKQSLVVDERAAEAEYADWFGVPADKAMKDYVADPRANRQLAQALSALWPLRSQIVDRRDQRAKLQTELAQLNSEASQKRADLRAIEKNKAAEALRRSLTSRLAAIGTREDAVTAQNITIGQGLADLEVRWREGIALLHLTEALAPK